MEYARGHTRAGQTMSRLLELDFMADRFRIGWGEVTAEEVRGLQVLKEERDRFQRESKEEENRRQMEHAQRAKNRN